MAVYKSNYGRYSGELTPAWSRFLILPRYAFREVFQSRGLRGLLHPSASPCRSPGCC